QGVTSTQLSLLAAISAFAGCTVSDLAEKRGFDRTTLTRNLDRLEQMALVESSSAAHGNGRICAVTTKGRKLMTDLLPAWREAQAEMQDLLGGAGFADAIRTLQRLAQV